MNTPTPPPRIRSVLTGLSGNEIWCLQQKGYAPGDVVIGNSVHSLGFLGGIGAGLQNIFGGEVTNITSIIHEGRQASYERMVNEAKQRGGTSIAGVTSERKHFRGNIEFLSVASCVHGAGNGPEELAFTSDCDGQELFCMMDAGYTPVKFVFGNVAYSIGVGGGLLGGLKSLARGEIREYSDVFNATRHLALERAMQEAQAAGANAVLAIDTRIMPFQGVHEMLMMGTAARHPALENGPMRGGVVSSDLTCEEMWNLANLGYAPMKLVLATAVYSLGVVGGLMAALKSFVRGEISDLTSLIYDAREHALGLLRREADALGADDVVGIRTHVHEFQGLIEFMAIGTAVKRMPGIGTASAALPVQAIIRDRETWISDDDMFTARIKDGNG